MKRLPPIILSRTAKTSAKLFSCHKASPPKAGTGFASRHVAKKILS
jgi:hypothetical protein